MKKLFWILALLASGVFFWTGCGDDNDDDGGNTTIVVTNAPAGPDANAQFAALVPAGLVLEDKFTIVGRGTVYTLRCDAIAGAASYTFTTSFGSSETVAEPTVADQYAGADDAFTFSVHATNADGFNTQTASATVN